jgi:hypothetical protein
LVVLAVAVPLDRGPVSSENSGLGTIAGSGIVVCEYWFCHGCGSDACVPGMVVFVVAVVNFCCCWDDDNGKLECDCDGVWFVIVGVAVVLKVVVVVVYRVAVEFLDVVVV